MTKSSAVLFILFFSLVFKLEEPVSVLIHLILEEVKKRKLSFKRSYLYFRHIKHTFCI